MTLRFNNLLLFLFSFLFLNYSVFSQNLCRLTIKVLNEETSEVIRNAVVYLDGTKKETQKTDTGNAIFTSLSSGPYTITVKADGYYDKIGKVTIDPTKKNDYTGTFSLKPLKQNAPIQSPDKKNGIDTAKVTINIMDAESGEAIKNATVELAGAQKLKKETNDGTVVFEKVANGTCVITVTSEGYENKSGKVEIDFQKRPEYLVRAKMKMIKKQKTPEKPLQETVKASTPVESSPLPESEKQITKTSEAQTQTPALINPLNITNPLPPSEPATLESPVLKGVMIAASIFSCLVLLSIVLAFLLKWSVMTGTVKVVLCVCFLCCAIVCFVLITATCVMFFSIKSTTDPGLTPNAPFKPSALSESLPATIQKGPESIVAEKKAPVQAPQKNVKKDTKTSGGVREAKIEKLFASKETRNFTLEEVSLEDTAGKHDMGSMIFMKGVKENNAADKEKGLALLEESFRAEPGNALYIFDLADAYVQMNTLLHMKLATDLYRGLLETAPENDKLLARTADAYARMYQYDKAFQYAARRAWSGGASPVTAASQIALISLLSRDLDRGIFEVSQIIKGGPPETSELNLILAGLYAENGKKEQAAEILDGIIKTLPEKNDLSLRAQIIKGSIVK